MKKIIFYGGTGQAKVMRPIADKIGKLVAVLDDTEDLTPPFSDVPLYCGKDCFQQWEQTRKDDQYYFAVTIGNPNAKVRIEISDYLAKALLKPVSLIHETASIDPTAKLGTGAQVHAGALVGPYATIGNYCILNTNSLVEHDCILNDGVELGPSSVICGEVAIQDFTWIGANSTVRQRTNIGKNVIVGAGSVVVKDIEANTVVVGNPAKPLIKNHE